MSADSWGVAYGFTSSDGDWVDADPRIRQEVRNALRAPIVGSDAADTGPADDGALVRTVDETYTCAVESELRLEDGTTIRIGAGQIVPSDVPIGYHTLTDIASGASRGYFLAPKTCVPVHENLTWGWAVQMYAMRSRNSWGIGEFADLRTLTNWSAARGAGMVLVNPLHAVSPVISQQPSPYFPASRVFRNPLALTISEVPGYADHSAAIEPLAAQSRARNADRRIDRDHVFGAKYAALEILWRAFRDHQRDHQQDHQRDHRTRFDAYCASEGQTLRDFAIYSAIAEQRRASWMEWPTELRDPRSPAVQTFAAENNDRVAFHQWVQWLVQEQINSSTPNVDLMTDLAIGCDRGGADAWIWQESFALDMSVGAPPDTFNTRGQNWGLPPFDPWRLRRNNYEAFIRVVRSAFQGAQALRMDHVMGLFRLYWIPEGETPANGCYVYLPFRDLLGIVAIESQRAGAYVVGEDLGTVESYVREELSEKKILSYKLLQFEGGPAAEFSEQALAAYTTHDLPTIPGLWTRFDVTTQTEMGLQPNVEGTEHVRTMLATRSGVPADAPNDRIHDVVVGTYKDLATSPCRVLTACLDDALGIVERPNMPGTIDEWPNWRIALPMPLEDILEDHRVADVAAALNRA